jgi:hypothetical protein
MVGSAPSSRAKAAAVAMLLLGALFLLSWHGVDAAASYLGLMAAVIAVLAVVSAQRLWSGGHLDGRLLACVLSVVAFVGGLLNLTVGLPGAPSLHESSGPATWVAFALEVGAVWLIARDHVHRTPETTTV